jgi:hypothetical protein
LKLVLLTEDGQVQEIIEGIGEYTATCSSITWATGGITGISSDFVVLDDLIEIDLQTLPFYVLDFTKQVKERELKDQTEINILKGFTGTNGHIFDFDYKDQNNINQQLSLLLLDTERTSVDWRTRDVGILTFTRDEFIQICRDAENWKRTNIGLCWQRIAEMQQLENVEQIKKFSLEKGNENVISN